jgi:UDP-N-acetylglucosamine--N-acetylmuramyl-(pentapeptide) pyrophosphoryl-undecaprenol N-acetylglucosamine transferase
MRFIISGGGTGGHIFPAIAIAEAIKKQLPDAEFLFVGALGKMEMEKVPQAGYKIEGLWISGFQRKNLLKNLLLPVKIIFSIFKVWGIISRFKPDAVIGVGGYASAMALKVAGWRKIPVFIHEQNSFAGKTNQMLAKTARKIFVAYDGMEKFFPAEKIEWTGNPVRTDILNIDAKKAEASAYFGFNSEKKTLFVTGGSLGSKTLNESVFDALDIFKNAGIQLIWQAGKGYYDAYINKVSNYENVKLVAFVERMDLAYAIADLVVCRAGALTISELCVCGKAAILIPSPNVAEDHQTLNAMALVNKKAALLVKDDEAKEKLKMIIMFLLADTEHIKVLENNIKLFSKPDAAKKIAKLCINAVTKN